jgi:hypothetical protein
VVNIGALYNEAVQFVQHGTDKTDYYDLKKSSFLPEEYTTRSINGTVITVYTVDAELIQIRNPSIKYASSGSGPSRTTEISTTVPYIFESKKGNHFTIRLTNFSLDTFAVGVRVTILMFMSKGKEYLFSIYNHSDPGWIEFPFSESPFSRNIDLHNKKIASLFVPPLVLALFLLIIN